MIDDADIHEFVLTIFLSGISLMLFWILIRNFKTILSMITAMILVVILLSTSYYSIQSFKGFPSNEKHLPNKFMYYWHRVVKFDERKKRAIVLLWIKREDDLQSRLIRVEVDAKTARQLNKVREMVRKKGGNVNMEAKKGRIKKDEENYKIRFVPRNKEGG